MPLPGRSRKLESPGDRETMMTNDRAGPLALIAGAVLSILVFAFHPSHVVEQPLIGPFTLSQLVHGAALLGVPLLAYG